MASVKNTKEAITLSKVITSSILERILKDGYQWDDLTYFLQTPEFQKAIGPAVEDADEILVEGADLNFFEGIELAKHIYSCVDEILEVVKKYQSKG